MMQSALKLIHLTALDPEPKLASEFERWYLGEYLAKVLERPGCRGVRVFECIDAEPRYVTIYDLDETRVDFVQGFSAAPFHEATFDRREMCIRDSLDLVRRVAVVHEAIDAEAVESADVLEVVIPSDGGLPLG